MAGPAGGLANGCSALLRGAIPFHFGDFHFGLIAGGLIPIAGMGAGRSLGTPFYQSGGAAGKFALAFRVDTDGPTLA